MKKQDEEPSLRIVLIALIITAITIAVLFLPVPNAEAPQDVELKPAISEAEAEALEDKVEKPVPKLRSELVRVCSCESTGTPENDPTKYHFESDGVTPLIGRYNSADRGMCQINMTAHSADIERLGLDIINSEEDYITFTNWLYDRDGLRPWQYSKHCWK